MQIQPQVFQNKINHREGASQKEIPQELLRFMNDVDHYVDLKFNHPDTFTRLKDAENKFVEQQRFNSLSPFQKITTWFKEQLPERKPKEAIKTYSGMGDIDYGGDPR
jgi:hypothetical protein